MRYCKQWDECFHIKKDHYNVIMWDVVWLNTQWLVCFAHVGGDDVSVCCDLMPGFRFAAFYKASNLVTLSSVWSRSLSLTMPLFVGIACINTQNVRLHIQFCNNDCVLFVQKTPEEFTFLSSIKTFRWRHISGPCSRIYPSETEFLSASVPRWMDGWKPLLLV